MARIAGWDRDRWEFLKKLYESAGGETDQDVNLFEVGRRLGLTRRNADEIARSLMRERFLRGGDLGGNIRLTREGVRAVQASLRSEASGDYVDGTFHEEAGNESSSREPRLDAKVEQLATLLCRQKFGELGKEFTKKQTESRATIGASGRAGYEAQDEQLRTEHAVERLGAYLDAWLEALDTLGRPLRHAEMRRIRSGLDALAQGLQEHAEAALHEAERTRGRTSSVSKRIIMERPERIRAAHLRAVSKLQIAALSAADTESGEPAAEQGRPGGVTSRAADAPSAHDHLLGRCLRWLKNRLIVVVILLVFMIVVGLVTLTEALAKLWSLFSHLWHP